MKTWKGLQGLPVIKQDSGRSIGRVEQVWLHAGGRQMQGVSIKGRGLRAKKLYAAMGDIRLLGDVSMIVSAARAQPAGTHGVQLGQNVKVFSVDGEKIGWLTDAQIEEDTGNVTAVEVSRGYIDDWRSGREWVREFTFRPCGVIAVLREPGATPGLPNRQS
jgi:uncharacterized protein YrrD